MVVFLLPVFMALQQMYRYFQMKFKDNSEVFAKPSFVCQRENDVYITQHLSVAF